MQIRRLVCLGMLKKVGDVFFMTYKDLYCNESSQEENFEDVVRCDFLGVFLNVENNLVSIETRVKEVFERGKCKYLSICNVFIDF